MKYKTVKYHHHLWYKNGLNRLKKKSNIKCNFFETASDVPDPRDLNSEDKNLMFFDDLLLERQNKCESYYIRGLKTLIISTMITRVMT